MNCIARASRFVLNGIAGATLLAAPAVAEEDTYIFAEIEILQGEPSPQVVDGKFVGFKRMPVGRKVIREATACIQDAAGSDHTVRMKYVLLVNNSHLGIDLKSIWIGNIHRIEPELSRKFPKEKVKEATAFVERAWRYATSQYKLEEIQNSTEEFTQTMNATIAMILAGRRIVSDEPSFQEREGIGISTFEAALGTATPGC